MMDDFNYPTAQRSDTMTLQCVERAGAALKRRPRDVPPSLSVQDIEGARAGTTAPFRAMRFTNRSDFSKNEDIERSSPMPLIPTVVKRPNTFHLSNADIEGTVAKATGFRSTRMTDPNNPSYKLPSFETAPVAISKQLSETNQVVDIDGAHAKPKTILSVRQPLKVEDIDGAKAGTTYDARMRSLGKDRPPENPTFELQHSDAVKTNRQTNPLTPRYKYDLPEGMDADLAGVVQGNHPKPPRAGRQPEANLLSLRTSDLPGATPLKRFQESDRRLRNPVDISDIPDAHPTVLHAAFHYKKTQRCVDPLQPCYPPLKWKSEVESQPGAFHQPGTSYLSAAALDALGTARPVRLIPQGDSNPNGFSAPKLPTHPHDCVSIPSVMSLPKCPASQ
eukprot:GGOE01004326.1.p1 GENE.GGOE01004326.1~~GGOE01004326.1.p1  ORF type:complete len:391 (+),score=38.75 GGOE01004326.1:60-1232(+)